MDEPPGPARADAGPEARLGRGAPLSSGLVQDPGAGPNARPRRGAPLTSDLSIKRGTWWNADITS